MLSKHVKALLNRKGKRLFEVRGDDGTYVTAEAEHLNAYLRPMLPSGCTAKTFRTWHGTVAAFEVLETACQDEGHDVRKTVEHVSRNGSGGSKGLSKRAIEKTLREAVKVAAARLGNTTTVCKAYYIHPAVCDLYAEATLSKHLRTLRHVNQRGLKPIEQRLLALLTRIAGPRRRSRGAA